VRQKTHFYRHRLSTIINADQVLVIHNGEIAESGTHDSLVKERGQYYTLWSKQIRSARKQNESRGKTQTEPIENMLVDDVSDSASLESRDCLVDTAVRSLEEGDGLPTSDTGFHVSATGSTPSP
jgi:ABC-type multidrug transport system ATPase subunit